MTTGFALRRANFADTMEFYAPGLKRWETPEWKPSNPRRFLPVSVTGSACALSCDHCQAKVLDGMISVKAGEDLFDLADPGELRDLISGARLRVWFEGEVEDYRLKGVLAE